MNRPLPMQSEGVVVANPGSMPEMAMMAAGLARSGNLATYFSPIAVTTPRISGFAGMVMPRRLRFRYEGELRRRLLPYPIEPRHARSVASLAEYAYVAIMRVRRLSRLQTAALRAKNLLFDGAVAKNLNSSDRALVGFAGTSLRSFRRAKRLGLPTFLQCSTVHHSFRNRILREEAILQPSYAPSLFAHYFPAAACQKMDAEIDLADWIMVASSFQKQTFISAGVASNKLIQAPLGVDTTLFRPTAHRDGRTFRIIFVGQISQLKGLSYLIKAFRNLQLPDAELLMVGQLFGPSSIWSGVPGVSHHPQVPRWLLPKFYATADAYVLPSLFEGFSLTALEAMACGLPVVLTENSLAVDLITHGNEGFIVPPRDTDALTVALKSLYLHPEERQRMGRRARSRAEEFSWELYARRISQEILTHAGMGQPVEVGT